MLQPECVRPPFRQNVTFPIAGLRAAVRVYEAPEVSHPDTPSRHFRCFPYRPTFCRTSSWVARLDTRSAVSRCCGSSRRLWAVRLGLLLTTVALLPAALLAQLTTGTIEGTLRATDGRPVADSLILITGRAGFRT